MFKSMLDQVSEALASLTEEGLALVKDFAHKLASNESGKWIAEAKKFLRGEPCWISAVGTVITSVLRLISSGKQVIIPATDGTKAIVGAREVFAGYIDSNFKNWRLDVSAPVTPDSPAEVYELIDDATFAQMFTGNLNKLVLTQHQIIEFCRTHRKWLRTDGYATLFLFKVGSEYFVADVSVGGRGRLLVVVDRFSDEFVWDGGYRHRLVIPQLVAL